MEDDEDFLEQMREHAKFCAEFHDDPLAAVLLLKAAKYIEELEGDLYGPEGYAGHISR
jgi:hypothetical protein